MTLKNKSMAYTEDKNIDGLDVLTTLDDTDVLIAGDQSDLDRAKKITKSDFQADLTVTASQVSDFDTEVANNSAVTANTAKVTYPSADSSKLAGIEAGAEANNISDANATDLTDAGDSTLHYHATDRARANHTGTQVASTISDFDTEVANNSAVAANTAKVGITPTQASNITTNNAKETNATHSGEVTGNGALTIADNIVDEANLKLDEAPTNDYVLTADSAKTGGMKWAASGGGTSSPLTTKGDLYGYDTDNERLPVGADATVLTADSTQALGMKWATVAGGGDVTKVGTPVDSQIGVWTGDGTIEGTTGFTYDGSNLAVTGGATYTSVNGIDLNPGSDIDCDLLTVGVTGSPRLYWDESASDFRFTHSLFIASSLDVTGDLLLQSDLRFTGDLQTFGGDDRIVFDDTSSAVNAIGIKNNTTTNAPEVQAVGTDTNIDLELTPKGTGTVNADGVEVATISGTQTLTNKTFDANGTGNSLSNIDVADHSATGTPSSSTYYRGDNTWASIAGGGDVSKVGTPVNNQVGVWTGDGTLEGDTGLTYSGSNLGVTGSIEATTLIQAANLVATGSLYTNGDYFSSVASNLKRIAFTDTASAVNHIGIKSNSTGNNPELQAAGTDTNIDLALIPKGTGAVTTTKAITATGAVTGSNLSGTNTGDESDASATVKGIVELATTAETSTGTDATRAVTPDGLADSKYGNTSLVSSINFVIDGGGSAITTGIKGFIEIPFACTITEATLLADQSGSIVVDIWKDTYLNYPPTVADTITASDKPTISSATKDKNSTLTGWTTSVTAGNILGFNVDSITTCERVTLALKIIRT